MPQIKRKILKENFFDRPTVQVAEELLGKYLCRGPLPGKSYMITEVEAYDGLHDKGSHAWHGETKRNFPMFGPAGYWYVYFTYGMHWMLNIVTREKGYPAAVLIRGLKGEGGGNLNGPGRLTKYLHIDKRFNAKEANKKTGLWIEDRGINISSKFIKHERRIGINYAGDFWVKRKWRFLIDPRYLNADG